MKIEQIISPSTSNTPGASVQPQISARERAIQALLSPKQDLPVKNATSISPEEASVVTSKKAQNYNSESVVDSDSTSSSESPAETKASEEPLSSKYAILARKEKMIRQREAQLKAREAEMSKSKDVAAAPAAPAFDPSKYVDKSRLTQDPFAVLGELGLDYEKLTDMLMNAPSQDQLKLLNQVKALESKIAEIEGNTKKTLEQKEVENRQAAVNQITSEVKRLVTADDSFEMVRARGAVKDVVQLIERTFDEEGYLMSVEEAAQKVEDHLIEEQLRFTKLKKIQSRLSAQNPAPKEEQPKAGQSQQQMKTLSNSISASRPLTAKERAMLAFEGKLNK